MKKSELFFTFLLIPVDLLMILFGFILAYKSRFYFGFIPEATYVEPIEAYFRFIILFIPLWIVAFSVTGLYSSTEKRTFLSELGKVIVAISASIALIMAWIFLSRTFFFSRLIIIFAWVMIIFTVMFGRVLIRFIQRRLYRYSIGVHKVIILGKNSYTKPIIEEIKSNRRLGYEIVKVIDDDGIEKLDTIVKRSPCDEIIIADSDVPTSKIDKILTFCRKNNLSFKMTPNLLLVSSSHVGYEQLAGVPILEFKRTPLDGWGRIIKRIIDIFGSVFLIVLTSPIMILTALLIKITSKGPILFKQERVGLEKNFKFMKFRSMKIEYCTGDEYGGKKADKYRENLSKTKK